MKRLRDDLVVGGEVRPTREAGEDLRALQVQLVDAAHGSCRKPAMIFGDAVVGRRQKARVQLNVGQEGKKGKQTERGKSCLRPSLGLTKNSATGFDTYSQQNHHGIIPKSTKGATELEPTSQT